MSVSNSGALGEEYMDESRLESMSQLYLVVSKLMYLSSVQYRTTSDRVTHIDEFSKSQFLTPFKHLTIMIFTKLFYKSLHYRI